MRTDKNFKLSKSSKRMLALFPFKDEHARGSFKRRMVDAEASAMRAKLAKIKDKE